MNGDEEKVDLLAEHPQSLAVLYGRGRPHSAKKQRRLALLTASAILIAFTFCVTRLSLSHARRGRGPASPFSGVFSRFPAVSALPPSQRRITLVAVWSHDDVPHYLHEHLYSAELNKDSVDYLFVNRIIDSNRSCVDWQKHNIVLGSNVKSVCITQEEYRTRLTNVMCQANTGWNCDERQRREVDQELQDPFRTDPRSNEWRMFHGAMYRDLFLHPELPFWAWVDTDTVLGRFQHFPFNILSRLSFITFAAGSARQAFLAGQLTAFNFDDEELPRAWMKIKTLQTPEHFTKKLEGLHYQSDEEQAWSFHMFNGEENSPGRHLSWAILPDLLGDDPFPAFYPEDRSNSSFLLSGRDLIYLERTSIGRKEMEILFELERKKVVDEAGGVGWSAAMLASHYNDGHEASDGLLELRKWQKGEEGCPESAWLWPGYRQCLTPHPLTQSNPSLLRASLVHFADQPAGTIYRRLEVDRGSKIYSRKLLKHALHSKRLAYGKLPPFDITEDHILLLSDRGNSAWKMGRGRERTLFRTGIEL